MINDNVTVFVLFPSEQIKLEPCDLLLSIIVNMQIKVQLPHQIRGTVSLLPLLSKQSLSIEKQILIRDTYSNMKTELLNNNFSKNIIIKKIQKLHVSLY